MSGKDSIFPLFDCVEQKVKRTIKQCSRYNPAAEYKPPPKLGSGFTCPHCGNCCEYDEKSCPNCNALVSYQPGTGVVTLIERNTPQKTDNSLSSKRKCVPITEPIHKKPASLTQPESTPSLDMEELERKNETLSKQLTEQQQMALEEDTSLIHQRKLVEEGNETIAKLEGEMSAIGERYQSLEQESNKTLQGSVELQHSNEELRRKLQTIEAEKVRLEGDNGRLEGELRVANDALEGREADAARLQTIAAEMVRLEEERGQLEEELGTANGELEGREADMEAMIRRLTTDKTEAEGKIKELKAELDSTATTTAQLKSDLAEKVSIIKSVNSSNQEVSTSRDELQRMNDELKSKHITLSERKKTLENRCNSFFSNPVPHFPPKFRGYLESQGFDLESLKDWQKFYAIASGEETQLSPHNHCGNTNPSSNDDAPMHHDPPSSESKSMSGRCICNDGNFCHMSCAVHALANIPRLAVSFLKEDFLAGYRLDDTHEETALENRLRRAMSLLQEAVATVGIMNRPHGDSSPIDIKDFVEEMGISDTQEDITEVRKFLAIFPIPFPTHTNKWFSINIILHPSPDTVSNH